MNWDQTQNMSVNLLARIPLFSDLPPEELDRLMAALEIVNLKPGDILFREGDIPEHLFIIVSGELEINMGSGTDNEIVLNVLKEGEYFGEMGLIMPGGRRTAGARAREGVILLSMSRNRFGELLQNHPKFANAMVSVLSQRLDSTNIATYRDLAEKNRQLQKAYDELKAAQAQLIEKERLERELKVAAEIQLSILP